MHIYADSVLIADTDSTAPNARVRRVGGDARGIARRAKDSYGHFY